MLTQDEKEQLADAGEAIKELANALKDLPEATQDEQEQLAGAKEALSAISDAISNTSEQPVTKTEVKKIPALDRLVPTGDLHLLKDAIKANMPVTDEQFNTIVKATREDLRSNSRLNGLMKNIAVLAQAVTKTVLPLFMV